MTLSLTYTSYPAGNATSFEHTNFIFSTDEDDGTGGGTRSMCLLMREFASEKEFLHVVVVKCTSSNLFNRSTKVSILYQLVT